jgi:AraC-like DNA-binding protein
VISESAIHHDARGEVIEPTIQPRVIRLGRPPQRWFHHVLLLLGGAVRLTADEGQAPVTAPAIIALPPSDGETVLVPAGSRGYLVGASPEIVGEAIGDHAESSSLRVYAARLALDDGLGAEAVREMAPLFEGFIAELTGEHRGSRMVISAYFRLILMAAWRLRRVSAVEDGRAQAGVILQRFRQSVEMGFRSHRSITDYAADLGISPDRLHAICQRTLGRSPIELVHDRMIQEAKLRLERSARGVQEISYGLGFRDPAAFSHFFKRRTGLSPRLYRSMLDRASHENALSTSSDYHDWP